MQRPFEIGLVTVPGRLETCSVTVPGSVQNQISVSKIAGQKKWNEATNEIESRLESSTKTFSFFPMISFVNEFRLNHGWERER
jgi:hypothetical protein